MPTCWRFGGFFSLNWWDILVWRLCVSTHVLPTAPAWFERLSELISSLSLWRGCTCLARVASSPWWQLTTDSSCSYPIAHVAGICNSQPLRDEFFFQFGKEGIVNLVWKSSWKGLPKKWNRIESNVCETAAAVWRDPIRYKVAIEKNLWGK